MPYLQRNINDMYRRSLAALEAEFADIPEDSAGAEAADGLRAAFAIIERKGGEQESFDGTAQAGTAQRAAARRNLYDFLLTLSRTANTISRKKPGFNRNYPSPAGRNDAEMLNDARAVAPKAVAEEADFTRLGLEQEFIESGAERLAAFEASFDATDEALSSRGAAVGSKKEAQEAAEDSFDELDIYIRNRYRNQPAKLAAWKIASRVERSAPKSGKGGEEKK